MLGIRIESVSVVGIVIEAVSVVGVRSVLSSVSVRVKKTCSQTTRFSYYSSYISKGDVISPNILFFCHSPGPLPLLF